MDTVLSVIGSIFSGGLTGLLGVGIQRVFDFLNKREEIRQQALKWDHDEKMKRIDGELMAQEWAQRVKVADVEAAGREAVADAAAFRAGLGAEPKLYSAGVARGRVAGFLLVGLDFVRGMVRPGLTIYLCAITTVIYLQARELLGDGRVLGTEQAVDLLAGIVNTVLYLTTTCILWWFGTRNKQQPPLR